MKKIISLLIIFTIFSTNSWEVFSEQKFHSSERKEILQEQKIEIPSEKKEFFQEQKKEKNIFQNVPESKQKIVNNFLEKYNKKWYFSQLEKISYRKKSTNRWLASWTKIYFDFEKIDTNEEFKRVMTHEMWHVFDLWYLKSKEKPKIKEIDLAGMFTPGKTLSSLTEAEREAVNNLLKLTLGKKD